MHYSFVGIVLDHIPYSDSSSIYKFLTRNDGVQSAMAKGLKGRRGKGLRPLLQRMNVVEVEAFRGAKQALGVLKGVRRVRTSGSDRGVRSTSILLFINELLCVLTREGHSDPELFDLVSDLLEVVEQSEVVSDLHLIFLMKLTKVFGAEPEQQVGQPCFDLSDASPCDAAPLHGHFVQGRECELFFKCLGTDLARNAQLGITNNERRSLLERILEYYSLQLDENLDLRSHKVLHTVLGEA